MAVLKGSYALVLELAESQRLTVGRLGEVDFPPGYYLYLGSALNGLEGRIRRHLRREKKLHWHIDFLIKATPVRQVWWVVSPERKECYWADDALGLEGVTTPCPGFGSSDCRRHSHLMRLPTRDLVEELRRRWIPETGGGGVFVPDPGHPEDRRVIL